MAVNVDLDDIERVMKQALVQHAKDRRERIATAVLAGFAADPASGPCEDRGRKIRALAVSATQWADALIAELDK